MEATELLLLAATGVAAGVINTLAGSGSAFTLAVFMFVGLDAQVANGTNRIGVLAQCAVGGAAMYKGSRFKLRPFLPHIIICTAGAVAGAYLASVTPPTTFNHVIGGVMLLVLYLLLSNPGPALKKKFKEKQLPLLALAPVLLAAGFYGGFIQVGIGVLLVVVFSLMGVENLVHANLLKMLIVGLYTVPVLGIYLWQGQVHWPAGLAMAAGQMLGAWLAAKFALKSAKAEAVIKVLLLVVVVVTLLRVWVL